MEPYTPEQVDRLAKFMSKHLISRTDVKARQLPTRGGGYVRVDKPWKMGDLRDHITGKETYGHYLLDKDSKVKFIAFDIDLETIGLYCDYTPENIERFAIEKERTGISFEEFFEFHVCNPRKVWLDHSHVGRPWLEYQMRQMVDSFFVAMYGIGGVTPLATYSGSKGVHVYGLFDGKSEAFKARSFATKVVLPQFINHLSDTLLSAHRGPELDERHRIVTSKGKNFYKIENPDGVSDLCKIVNFSIEIFPKQDHVEPDKFGNLMRLEFGKNNKAPGEPTFVIDMTKAGIAPHYTFEALELVLGTGRSFRRINEKVKNDISSE